MKICEFLKLNKHVCCTADDTKMTISFKVNYVNSYACQVSLISSSYFLRYLHLKWCHYYWDTLYFHVSCNNVIKKRLKYLSKEYKRSGQTDSYQIDELVKRKIRTMNEKICSQCQAANHPSSPRRTNCKGLLKQSFFFGPK